MGAFLGGIFGGAKSLVKGAYTRIKPKGVAGEAGNVSPLRAADIRNPLRRHAFRARQKLSTGYRDSFASNLPRARVMLGIAVAGAAIKKTTKALQKVSTLGTPGIVGYGKRGIDANNLNTDGLVQGLSQNRRS